MLRSAQENLFWSASVKKKSTNMKSSRPAMSPLLRALTYSRAAREPMIDAMLLRCYAALDAFHRGFGSQALFMTMCRHLLVAEELCQLGHAAEFEDDINLAHEALVELDRRHSAEGPGRSAPASTRGSVPRSPCSRRNSKTRHSSTSRRRRRAWSRSRWSRRTCARAPPSRTWWLRATERRVFATIAYQFANVFASVHSEDCKAAILASAHGGKQYGALRDRETRWAAPDRAVDGSSARSEQKEIAPAFANAPASRRRRKPAPRQ